MSSDTMRKLMESASLQYNEERDPTIEYTTKNVKNVLDRVIAHLEGNQSGVWHKLATRYARILRITKMLDAEKELVNTQIKETATGLFDAEDEVLTRVIETIQMTVTLSKATPAKEKGKEVFNQAAFVKDLWTVFPDLEKQLNKLKKKHTEMKDVAAVPTRLGAPKMKPVPTSKGEPKESIELEEGMMDNLKAWASDVLNSVMDALAPVDNKLAEIKQKYAL